MDLSRHMVLAGGQFQPVKWAIDEGGNGWFKGELRKAVFGQYKGERVKAGYIVVPKSNNDATKDKQQVVHLPLIIIFLQGRYFHIELFVIDLKITPVSSPTGIHNSNIVLLMY